MERCRLHTESSCHKLLQRLGISSIDEWLKEQTTLRDRSNTQTLLGNILSKRIPSSSASMLCAPME
ncbi:MAG TPA: hypothetical protein V6D14_04640 [Coleofasciculaceae cyanobacterium]